MNELLYWIIEYIKVFLGYGFIMFVWPSVVFRTHLRGKGMTYRFAFCTSVQIVIVNSVVLLLGLVHILNPVTIWLFFYGVFIWSIREKWMITEQRWKSVRSFFNGTFGWKHFVLKTKNRLIALIKTVWKTIWNVYKKRWLEYTLLAVVIIYGMIYFTYAPFNDHSFGFGDMYVHHSWTYELTQGNIFSEGVYPEGMHCMLYAIHTLFGIDIYSCLLFLAGIHVSLTLLAAYCLMKEVFKWRYSPIFVLIAFLTLDVVCVNEVFSMSRLQWTLPQEYGFPLMYICAAFLIKYLKSDTVKDFIFKKIRLKGCYDENLFVFMMSLAATIVVHFYATIMAFLICAAFAVFMLKRIFNKKHFVPLVVAVVCGLMIAVIPMAGALASGIPFQGSIDWAVNIMNGIDPEQGYTPIAGGDTAETVVPDVDTIPDTEIVEDNTIQSDNTVQSDNTAQSGNTTIVVEQKSLFERVKEKAASIGQGLLALIKEKAEILYWDGYVTLYKQERSNWILGFTCIPFALWFINLLVGIPFRLLKKKYPLANAVTGYAAIAMSTVFFMIIYAAALLGLPGLVAGARLCSTEQMLILMVMIIPFDIIFAVLKKFTPDALMQFLSLGAAGGLVAFVWLTGNWHGYLYYELTRYNAAVMVTNEIMDSLPKNSYTIVSTTDEIYQVIQNGRHEELLTFLTADDEEERYTLPTEYVFIYVEKKPLKYAHNHFFSGPDWLALERYQEIYAGHDLSVCPDVFASGISEGAAQLEIMFFGRPSLSYSTFSSRIVLESKAYEWCQKFDALYPNELKTYYEDENFVCYYFRQNTDKLYDLVIE